MSDTHYAVDWSSGVGLCGTPSSDLTMWLPHVDCTACRFRLGDGPPADMHLAIFVLVPLFRTLRRFVARRRRGT